jgi:hypothetical protein
VGPSPFSSARTPRDYGGLKLQFGSRKQRHPEHRVGNSQVFANLEFLADREGQADWSRDGSQARYRHVVATGLDTIVQVRLYDDVLHKDVVDHLLRTIPEDLLDTNSPLVLDEGGGAFVFRYVTGVGRKFLIPDTVFPVYSPDGDGTVPFLSARRISTQQNLNEPRAEIFQVPEDGEREHTDMLGNPNVLNFILSALRPWEVTRTDKVRQHTCTGSQCAP